MVGIRLRFPLLGMRKVGSSHGTAMGKQRPGTPPRAASSEQHSSEGCPSGVRVMSWSTNWPICINIIVAPVSYKFEVEGWNSKLTLLGFGRRSLEGNLHSSSVADTH